MNTDAGKKPTESALNYLTIVRSIVASWRLVAKGTGVVAVLAIVISLILPKYYESTIVILPSSDDESMMAMGGLSNLASLAGISVGATNPEALYPAIITSETIMKDVIYKKYTVSDSLSGDSIKTFNLVEYWNIHEETPQEQYERTLEKLRNELNINVDKKTFVVTLSIQTKYPSLSADILNTVASLLDKFLRTERVTTASEQRKWIAQRLSEVQGDLANSENRLAQFRGKNRRIVDSPELLLEQDRLIRDVEINATLFGELKKQYELVKIQEIKNIPVINVMDSARPAAIRSRPKRALIVVVSTFFGFLMMAAFVYVSKQYEKEIHAEWNELILSMKVQRGNGSKKVAQVLD